MATFKVQQTQPVSNTPAIRKSPLELLIAQQAMAQNADANTMAGFALAKLLRGLFDDWKSRYDARGILNEIKARKAEDQAAALANLEKTNPQQYQLMQGYINADGSKWASLRQTPPQTTGVNQNARAVQQAPAKLLGDTDWLKRNDFNFSEYNSNSLDDILRGTGAGWWRNGL